LDWLHYNYFRTYDPSTGRYLESDPLGLYAGPNTYGYVGGNPLRFTDRTGQCPWCIAGALIGGGLNAYMQAFHGDGPFDWGDFAAATAIGAAGGGLGTLTKGLSFGRALAANSIGSAAAAAGVTAAQNRIFGSCKDVTKAATNGLVFGALGSAAGSAFSNGISALSRARYFGVPLSVRSLLTSNSLQVPRNTGLEPLGVTAGDIAANAISNLPGDSQDENCGCDQ